MRTFATTCCVWAIAAASAGDDDNPRLRKALAQANEIVTTACGPALARPGRGRPYFPIEKPCRELVRDDLKAQAAAQAAGVNWSPRTSEEFRKLVSSIELRAGLDEIESVRMTIRNYSINQTTGALVVEGDLRWKDKPWQDYMSPLDKQLFQALQQLPINRRGPSNNPRKRPEQEVDQQRLAAQNAQIEEIRKRTVPVKDGVELVRVRLEFPDDTPESAIGPFEKAAKKKTPMTISMTITDYELRNAVSRVESAPAIGLILCKPME